MTGRRLVVVPTYQEIENITRLVGTIRQACPEADILVVDDGSPDGTADAAAAAGAQVLRRTGERGLGPAYVEGYRWALAEGYTVIAGMDADFSHDPAVLPELFRLVEDGAEMAVGSRYVTGGAIENWPVHRRLLSRWGNRYAIGTLRLPVHDATTGFRALSADLLRRLALDSAPANGYGFLIELVYRAKRAGARIVETPITFVDRTHGVSKMRARIIAEAMLLVTAWGLRDRLPRSRRAPWLLAAVTFAVCMAMMPEYPTDWDGVNLSLGLDRFDITHHSPQPPGYWLYVFVGRAIRWLTPWGAATSMTIAAAAAAGAAVATAFVVGRRLGGDWLAWAAAACLLTSPYLLFFGSTVSTYPFDALLALVVVLLALDARPGSHHGWLAAGALGLGAGFRQTSLIVLAPVLAVAVVRSVRSARAAMAVAAAGAIGVLAWLVPTMAEQPGGWSAYRAFSRQYLRDTLVRTSVFGGAPRTGIVNNLGQVSGYTLAAIAALVPAALVAWLLARRAGRPDGDGDGGEGAPGRLLLWLAVLGPLGFVVLVHFGKSGYVLSYLPALVLLLLRPATALRGRALALVTALVVLGCVVNVQRFAEGTGILPTPLLDKQSLWLTQQRHGAPYRVTRKEMQWVDATTRTYRVIDQELDPRRDVLVYVIGNGAHRFRHGTWSLPRFTIHYVSPGVRWNYAAGSVLYFVRDATVPVPPGGRAAWVIDVPTPETLSLEAAGAVQRHVLSTGATVFLTRPGVTMYGLTVVEGPPGPA